MNRALGGYARTFNQHYHRQGHLFQNRFKSILVEEEPYLLELVRYIHLNPLRAGLVANLAALDRYPWTGHSRLMGTVENDWQDVDAVLGLFGGRVAVARRAYRRFVQSGVAHGARPDLSGGGLRRSRHGCEVVDTLVRGRERWVFDERVPGSSDFVRQLQSQELARERGAAPRRPTPETLARVLSAVARHTGLSVAELCSGSKRHDVTPCPRFAEFPGAARGRPQRRRRGARGARHRARRQPRARPRGPRCGRPSSFPGPDRLTDAVRLPHVRVFPRHFEPGPNCLHVPPGGISPCVVSNSPCLPWESGRRTYAWCSWRSEWRQRCLCRLKST